VAGGSGGTVSIPVPRDEVLGRRADALLDGAAVADALRERLGADVSRCEPRYARYKPRTSLLVQYTLELEDGRSTLAHAWLHVDGRAEQIWRSASFARLLERTERRHDPGPPGGRALFLDGVGALVELSPVDSRLRALVRASSARKLRRVLRDAAGVRVEKANPNLVRHKPARKALLRSPGVYVKLYADGGGARRLAVARRVAAAGVPTAPPVTYLTEFDAAVYREAAGTRLADLHGVVYADALKSSARALAALHRVPCGEPWDRSAEAARIYGAAAAVGALVPEAAPQADSLADEIVRRLAGAEERVVLAHGDFYDDQLLVWADGAVLIDLDEARPAHPLLDVGNFLAHLGARTPGGERLREPFLAACDAAGIDVRGAEPFEAAALLALAVGPFRRLEPDWPQRVQEIVALAAARLRARPRRSRDASLPQLRVLCDERRAGRALSRALGRPVAVSSVSVVRHKPGRRCTLSYVLADGRRLFAKTYASGRAGRVHESTRRLAAAGVPVPAPLGWDSRARFVVLAEVAGAPAAPAVADGERWIGFAAAELLHSLHGCGASLLRRHELRDELRPLEGRVERLAAAVPQLAPCAARCLALARAGAELPWHWRLRPVHRDFYEDQLMLCSEGLAVLDADDAAMSEPALDVANFAAHLRLLGERPGIDSRGPAAVRRTFLRRYAELDPDVDRALTTFLEGTTLLRLAAIHGDWTRGALAARLLQRSERLLAAAPAGRRGRKGAPMFA
jgi:thiamine kinase-like enzyme